MSLHNVTELVLTPDPLGHGGHPATQAAVVAVCKQHKRRDFITVSDVETVTSTLEEDSGTTSHNASIAELEFLVVPHCVCKVDQFLVLNGLERCCDHANDLTDVAADIGHMGLDGFTSMQGQRDSIDTPAQVAFDFAAVDVGIAAVATITGERMTVCRRCLRDLRGDVYRFVRILVVLEFIAGKSQQGVDLFHVVHCVELRITGEKRDSKVTMTLLVSTLKNGLYAMRYGGCELVRPAVSSVAQVTLVRSRSASRNRLVWTHMPGGVRRGSAARLTPIPIMVRQLQLEHHQIGTQPSVLP